VTITVRLALQIFRKDIERLWWAVLLTLLLLAVFAFQEVSRPVFAYANYSRGGGGAWLNLALPFAWSLLIALVIHQDPLTGDRQFWVSLPCGWSPLLAAKAIFIAVCIQLPYLCATAAILLAKGFNPLEHIPHLFWKQLILLAFILPAVAVAAVVKNVAHFLLVVITIAGGVIMMSNRLNFAYGPDTWWDVRWVITLLILVIGGITVAALQFVRRCTLHSRAIGVAVAAAAFGFYSWLPRDMSAAIRAAFSPAPAGAPISVTVGSLAPTFFELQRYYNNRRTTILIPLQFSGLDPIVQLDQISLELTSAGGEHYEAQWPHSSNEVRSQRITTGLDMHSGKLPPFQWLELGSPEIAKRLLNGTVTINGRFLARFYKPGGPTTLRSVGRTDVPGLGYCLSSGPLPTGRVFDMMLTFECESPELTSREMLANGGSFLRDRINFGPSRYPEDPWLSPLHGGISANSVAKDAPLPSRRDTVAPAPSIGSAIIDYTFPGVDLNRFLVRQPVRPESEP